ncbi:DUF2515 domain-containing protein [Cytobacillus sp. FJAT-54145]|uniref:DUF2515 domain-containing protein n=1 Tax=Cytobacillus spartinae TaxID=3299023 RepID=A0ABW6KDE1_9BACI
MRRIHSYQTLTKREFHLIHQIKERTSTGNLDNISRTEAYFSYYKQHHEIPWAFLASMVSRNAGWNMCDLEGAWFPRVIDPELRKSLFLTYERANWLIFQDAFPQLLLYHYSTKINEPMFHLLKFFHVSSFMEKEWNRFWHHKNIERLMIALIINEQNVIQKPVIKHPIYRKRVFHSFLFYVQDWFHFSTVLFPTCEGELYGASVYGFQSIDNRINLGKRLASILFHPNLYASFYDFSKRTVHTGSRNDYERYLHTRHQRTTPFLRTTYPVIDHHIREFEDWSKKRKVAKKWFAEPVKHKHPIHINDWFEKKQKQLHSSILLKEILT